MSEDLREERCSNLNNTLPLEVDVEREANKHSNYFQGIFRVAKIERPLFFSMSIMFFIIAFVYSVMRTLKDAFVLDCQEQTSIVFLKNAVIVFSIAVVFIIQILLIRFKVSHVLMGVMSVYVVYLTIFGVVLYPLSKTTSSFEYFTIDYFGDEILAYRGFSVFYSLLLVFNFPTSSIFYIMSEMWGNLILSLLFMTFSNDVLTFKQTLRFIPLFYIGSNIGLLFSGITSGLLGRLQEHKSYDFNRFTIPTAMVFLASITIACVLIHYNLEKNILNKKLFIADGVKKKKIKKKVGMVEGLKQCFQSKLLLNFCIIVLAYNITVNIIDSIFKIMVKKQALLENKSVESFTLITESYNQIVISLLVILALMTPLSRLVETMGWLFTGLVAPVLSIVTSLLTLSLAVYNTAADDKHFTDVINRMVKLSPDSFFFNKVEFNCSRISSILFKVTKYAFFDVAKESLSMRINADNRANYKAVYDGVIGKLGKAANSLISIVILYIVNVEDARRISSILLFISTGFFVLWIVCVWYLAGKYDESLAKNADIDPDLFIKDKAAGLS